jgi:Bacterial Ig-like domain (group 2)
LALTCTVAVTPNPIMVQSGGHQTFTGTVTGTSCGTAVTWTATAGTIASLTSTTGRFTAPLVTTVTNVTITATQTAAPHAAGHATAVIFPPTLNSITVTPASASILIGNTVQFTATGNYSDGTMQNLTSTASWTTSPTGIATVAAGLATGVSAGTTTVTATSSPVSGNASLTVVQPNPPIANDFFGMDINKDNGVGSGGTTTDPWPSNGGGVNFGTYRSLGSAIKWSDIEPTCNGGTDPTDACYTWTAFNQWYGLMQTGALGQSMMFTAYWTPTWAVATAHQGDACTGNNDGGCNLPSDLGTGDNYFKDFLIALFTHVSTLGGPGISYLEIWNEPNISTECNPATCTAPGLVQMTEDARCVIKGIGTGCTAVDASVLIVSSPPTAAATTSDCVVSPPVIASYLKTLLQDGVANYADVIGFHGYVNLPPDTLVDGDPASGATCLSTLIGNASTTDSVRYYVTTYAGTTNAATIPIFDTEASWGTDSKTNTSLKNNTWIREYPSREEAYTGIFYLIQATNTACAPSTTCNPMLGLSWYGWDFTNTGQFWDPTSGTTGALTQAGIAYQNVYEWVEGASPSLTTGPCTSSGSIWTCNLTRAGNYYAQAVWNNSSTCTTTCTTTSYTIPASPDSNFPYTEYRNLTGTVTTFTPGQTTVNISLEPILIDNNSAY